MRLAAQYLLLSSIVVAYSGSALTAQVIQPPIAGNKVVPLVTSKVTFDRQSGLYTYSYTAENTVAGTQNLWQVVIQLNGDASQSISNITSPKGWTPSQWSGNPTIGWAATEVDDADTSGVDDGSVPESPYEVKPGGSLSGFSFQSPRPPIDVEFFAQGATPIPSAGDAGDLDDAGYKLLDVKDDSAIGITNGPQPSTPNVQPSGRGLFSFVGISNDAVFQSPVKFVLHPNSAVGSLDASSLAISLNGQVITPLFGVADSNGNLTTTLDVGGSSALIKGSNRLSAVGRGKLSVDGSVQSDFNEVRFYVNTPKSLDLNGDGKINIEDVLILLANLGRKAGEASFDPRADVNGDGVVDSKDQAIEVAGASASLTLVIAPSSGNFGSIEVGKTSPVISFTVTNDTSSAMGYLGYKNLGEFYLQPGTCHLVNDEPMLNPGESCVFTAVFKPTTPGPASGSLSIQTSSGTFIVPLTGKGATLVIAPSSGNFGSIEVGKTSSVISFTVTNDTSSAMGYLGYSNLGEFYLQPGTCHLVNGEPMLNPGESCVFTAVFKPTTPGFASGDLSIQTSSGTFHVPMTGTGVPN